MKITINKNTLVQALQIITPITDKSTSKPILSNFLLKANSNGQVEFMATDYEISFQGTFPAQVDEEGSVCISAKMVLEVCREFLSDEIRIESDEQLWVNFTGGAARLRLPSIEVALYPDIEKRDLPNRFKISAVDLKKCIDLTLFATQTNETRKNLMGVSMNIPEGNISRWTATDGHRLSQVEMEVKDTQLNSPPDIIIPRKALVELQKVLDKSEDEVEVIFDDRSLEVHAGMMVILTRLVEGKFPNVDQVIPKDNDKTITVDRERLSNALRIVSIMSTDKIKPVKLSLSNGAMKLESEHLEYGETTNEIEVDYNGESLQIGFNARYILDVLTVASHGDKVSLELKGPLNPCLIRVPADKSFMAVVMPLRIEW